MIYTGAVYRAFKKDRGADIKTGLFMEESNTRAVVWMHTIDSVSLGQTEGDVGVVCVCVHGGLFTGFVGQSSEKHQ